MMTNASTCRRAFTLLELLLVVSIIAVLLGVGYGVLQSVANKGRKIKEVSAARTLINSFLSTPQDHDGAYILGYDQNPQPVKLPGGSTISGQPASRYPYRLAPYFNFQFKDTVLVNYNVHQLPEGDLTYMTSLNPALGMNSYFVGGSTTDPAGNVSFPDDCVRRPGMTDSPLLVFASAAYDDGKKRINGFFRLTPPNLTSSMWSSKPWSSTAVASDYGQVDGRYEGQAVCAFTDGSIRSLSITELRDMRLWNRNAAAQNNPNYTAASSSSGGTGGGPRL